MRGISSGIAILATLVMVIVLLGIGLTAMKPGQPSVASTTTTLPLPDAIALVNAAGELVVIQNIGMIGVQTSEIFVYLDGIYVECLWDKPVVEPKQAASCILQGLTCSDKTVRVVGPSNEESSRCP
ncbi:MAG: hypothetical protein HYY37_03890 [Candidatus Aenigmarchaeota archaeon]|nr:hypothetical protein [Candidatus Aenigmarchaeota archaeon]